MRILILGAAGMFGHVACRVLAPDHEVYGTCRGPREDSPVRDLLPARRCLDRLEVGNAERWSAAFAAARPEVVINCLGVVPQRTGDPVAHIQSNALFPHQVARLADRAGAKLIQLGTDCVFSGTRGNYRPDDVPNPVDLYGRTKLLGEVTREPHLTLRTSMVGRQLTGAHGLVEWLITQRGGKVRGFVHAIWSGLTCGALAAVLGELVTHHPRLTGSYHVASHPVSKRDLLALLNAKLELGIEIVPYPEPHCDRSLDCTAFAAATGISVPSCETMIEQLADDSGLYEARRRTA
jgi:dTDP-4-dehydrorhamnose reductase